MTEKIIANKVKESTVSTHAMPNEPVMTTMLGISLFSVLAILVLGIEASKGHDLFVDNFESGVLRTDLDPQYGLNQGLSARQFGIPRGITYTRVSGNWYSDTAPNAWFSQVNHPLYPGKLMLTNKLSAVRLDAPLAAGSNNSYFFEVMVDPVVDDTSSASWASLMLSANPKSTGFPTNSDIALGITLSSNGGVQIYQRGSLKASYFVQPATYYVVRVSSNINMLNATVTINGMSTSIPLACTLPAKPFIFLGNYPLTEQSVTTFDDLWASQIDRDPEILYYGYWGLLASLSAIIFKKCRSTRT